MVKIMAQLVQTNQTVDICCPRCQAHLASGKLMIGFFVEFELQGLLRRDYQCCQVVHGYDLHTTTTQGHLRLKSVIRTLQRPGPTGLRLLQAEGFRVTKVS